MSMEPLLTPRRLVAGACLALLAATALATDPQRQADVARRGAEVMPFRLAATTHVFTKDAGGGVQQVVARDASDAAQVRLVRTHLGEIREQFLRGDFSGPERIHGRDMPGLAQLRAAPPGALAIDFRELPAGAELAYRSSRPELVRALHAWFDAQLADHGADARAGHPHQGGAHGPHRHHR